ncbi:hypothetical protein E0L36_01115 [Streptomyces sp. AJS327]|nr:hypothetical protein [Streptomyces sp. AJS327]
MPPEGPIPGRAPASPLAAPGTGQGNYTPPPIDPSAGAPLVPSATTDPSATGQWTMPFAPAEAGPGPAAEQAPPVSGGVSPAAAMGQGAAAALAGSHEARQRAEHGAQGEQPANRRPGVPGPAATGVPEPLGPDPVGVPHAGPPGLSGLPGLSGAEPPATDTGPAAAPTGSGEGAGTSESAGPAEPGEAADPTDPAEVPEGAGSPAGETDGEHPHTSYVLRVNGVDRPVTRAWIGESLLYVLRERLGLAGAKDGCAQGECGACSVQVDGRLVAACLVPAATAAGSEVRTVEGLAADGDPSDVQRALAECGAVQCGFCVPGLAMTVHDLLEGNHAPTELETRQAISGNLCRCSGYRGVLEAVRTVAAERAARAAELAERGPEDTPASGPAHLPHQGGRA